MARLMVLGSGGREHAIVWSLSRESAHHDLFCAPGNPGTAQLATNLDVDINDNDAILRLCKDHQIDTLIVGPEGPLANGLVDHLTAAGIRAFGPTAAGAKLEGSKLYAREFMAEYNIPHPRFYPCKSRDEVLAAVDIEGLPIVLKADGLAAGKGVIIARTSDELEAAIKQFYEEQVFGSAGDMLSVEQCLVGTEMSVFLVCDGENYCVLGTAQDYKRAFNGDKGPNTGGMGAIAPSPLATDELMAVIDSSVLKPTVNGLKKRQIPYIGFLYVGLMIVKGIPYVIEYNVRMGDPETQIVLPLLGDDLSMLINRAFEQDLPAKVATKGQQAICVVMAAEGYPGAYAKGQKIGGLDTFVERDYHFHAGTKWDGKQLVSNGGRVLNIVAIGPNMERARMEAYDRIERIDFPASFYRTDIGS